MSALEVPSLTPEPAAEDLVDVGVYPSSSHAADHGLVVLALGYPYWLVESADGFHVMIERNAAIAARAQLAAYDRESTRWPPPPLVDPWTPRQVDLLTPLLWAATILAVFQAAGPSSPAMEHGALDAQAIVQRGEVWRVVTALFLHADAAHVLSNALSGLLVFSAVLSTLGTLRGWLLLLAAAALGNFAVAALAYPGPYVSVGASTAIFAGVGLLTGRAIRIGWRSTHPHRWRAMFAPLAAGLTVLGLYGAGGLRVDVGAHLSGFAAGALLGFVAGLPLPQPRLRRSE